MGFDGDVDRFFRGQVNGLVGAGDRDGVYVSLARRSGGSRVRVVLLDAEPARGWTWGTSAGIAMVWVRQDVRHSGWGRRLLDAAPSTATSKQDERRHCLLRVRRTFTSSSACGSCRS